MARIRTIPPSQASGELLAAYERIRALYPPEYSSAPSADDEHRLNEEGVTALHSLLPRVMEPMMTALAELMSPDLPLTRRQHEMVNTVVSRANRCEY
jgi:hypothetical protein